VTGPLVIYHAHCPDGFAAALAAWLHFDGQGEYLPMTHEQALPPLDGREVYMLDIAFERAPMEQAASRAAKLVVLDHHQSAADALAGFTCPCGSVHFDMDKSAARLAWEYFHPDTPVPALVAHVEDRDLLRWLFEESHAYLASLDVGPYNFHRWAGVMRMPDAALERFLARGQAMHEQAAKLARTLAAEAAPITLCGQTGLMANAPNVFHSAVGELLLARSGTFALMWCLEAGGARIKVGLRGAPGFDTIPLATAFGGGGHPYASAFRLPLERLGELVANRLEPARTTS
jgi:hypothetical protein